MLLNAQLFVLDLDDTLFDSSGLPVNGILEGIRPFSGVVEFLEEISVPSVLVTMGHIDRQGQKVEKLGLAHFFQEVIVCDTNIKKHDAFARLLRAYTVTQPANMVVIGNRLDAEIRYGNEVGATTVLFAFGRYNSPDRVYPDKATHTVTSFAEILKLFV